MKKHMGKVSFAATVFLCGLFIVIGYMGGSVQVAEAQTGTVIGSVSYLSFGATTACSAGILSSQPIYNSYGTTQNIPVNARCANPPLVSSITLNTTDTIEIDCPYAAVSPSFTGPGSFNFSSIPFCSAGTISYSGGSGTFYNITSVTDNTRTPTNNPPSNLKAATTSDSTAVNLSWTINSTNQTGFDIERSISNGSFVQIATAAKSATAYTDTNLTPGVTYQYRVAAILSSGNTGYSNVASVITKAGALGVLTATMSSTNIGQVNLTWGSNTKATGYSIERSFNTSSSSFSVIKTVIGANTTSYTDDLSTANITGPQDIYRVRATYVDGTYSGYSNTASVSNCTAVSDTGPKNIILMRNNSYSKSLSEFISSANKTIYESFAKTDPWKTYFDKLSFYIDLKSDDVSNSSSVDDIKKISSCGDVTPFLYLIFGDSAASSYDGHVSEIPYDSLEPDYLELALHESGHAVGNLWDESQCEAMVGGAQFNNHSIPAETDCTKTNSNFKYNNIWYGGKDIGYDEPDNNNVNVHWFIPNLKNLMRYPPDNIKYYNTISCGFVVASIVDEPVGDLGRVNVDYIHARKHWPAIDEEDPSRPGCGPLYDTQGNPIQGRMNTTITGIPPLGITPTINNVSPVTSSSNTNTVSGSGFTPADNAVKLTPVSPTSMAPSSIFFANVYTAFSSMWNFFKNLVVPDQAHGQTMSSVAPFYEIDEISSADGSHISFTVPTTTPDGTYKVSVGAFNSLWNDTSFTIKVTGNGAGDQTTAVGAIFVPATPVYRCPTGLYTFAQVGSSMPTCTSLTYGVPNATPVAFGYSCPSTYTLSDTNCFINGGGVTPMTAGLATPEPATTIYTCPSTSSDLIEGDVCVPQLSSDQFTMATVLGYTCPGNKSILSGTVCNPINGGVITPATRPATAIYACPVQNTGYGSTFKPAVSADNSCKAYSGTYPVSLASISGYSCQTGWTLSGTTCNLVPSLTVAPGSLTSSATAQGQVTLYWNNNGAVGVTGVSVERSMTKNGVYAQINLVSPTAMSYTDTGLFASTTYYYNIRFQYGSKSSTGGAATAAPNAGPGTILPAGTLVPIYGPYATTTTVTTLAAPIAPVPQPKTQIVNPAIVSPPVYKSYPTYSPSPNPYPSPSPSPSPLPTYSPSPSPTPLPTTTPIASPSPTPLPTTTPIASPSPTYSPSPSPTPSSSFYPSSSPSSSSQAMEFNNSIQPAAAVQSSSFWSAFLKFLGF